MICEVTLEVLCCIWLCLYRKEWRENYHYGLIAAICLFFILQGIKLFLLTHSWSLKPLKWGYRSCTLLFFEDHIYLIENKWTREIKIKHFSLLFLFMYFDSFLEFPLILLILYIIFYLIIKKYMHTFYIVYFNKHLCMYLLFFFFFFNLLIVLYYFEHALCVIDSL